MDPLDVVFSACLRLGGLFLFVAVMTLELDGDDTERVASVLGPLGLGLLLLAALARAAASFRTAGAGADLPSQVGPVRLVSTRALRARMAVTLVLAVGVPVAASIAVIALDPQGWLFIAMALLVGVAGVSVEHRAHDATQRRAPCPFEVSTLLERLSIRADLEVPALVILQGEVATAWTSSGRLYLTTSLLETLERGELEAVLAHELAHLAHRDAPVMDLATAPSRVLLGLAFVTMHPSRLPDAGLGAKTGLIMFGLVYTPVGFVLGWASRLLVLGLSRARELSADAAAATLTGNPSALASALLKLDRPGSGPPRTDLRAVEALCIVEMAGRRRRRLLRTHPTTTDRVARLETMEARLQSGAREG
ncbi:MAG: M48 family metalloprotease [Thermoleophilaceae bacterium]